MGESLLKRILDFLQGTKFARTRFGEFIIGVLTELDAVTWPTKQEVYNSTVIVLVTMVLFAAYLGLWDVIMNLMRGWLFQV